MNEFEKWWDGRKESEFNDILECEDAWRAALEWVKTLSQTCPKGKDYEDGIINYAERYGEAK